MSLENRQMYSNFHIKLLIQSVCFSWSQLRAEIHKAFCSSSASLPLLFSPLPRCLLELSLESDLYYLSLTLSPELCLFLRLNGDLDKRDWAAREQLLNTKTEQKKERGGQRGARSQGRIYWAIRTLFQTPTAARDSCCLSNHCSGLKVQLDYHLKLILLVSLFSSDHLKAMEGQAHNRRIRDKYLHPQSTFE